ncbi:hypothetical protein QT974_23295 [Microcoleus sp. herbarium12]
MIENLCDGMTIVKLQPAELSFMLRLLVENYLYSDRSHKLYFW